VKVPDLLSVRRRAFRENSYTSTLFERQTDVPVGQRGILAHRTFNKNVPRRRHSQPMRGQQNTLTIFHFNETNNSSSCNTFPLFLALVNFDKWRK
jgi:hypothetical protein